MTESEQETQQKVEAYNLQRQNLKEKIDQIADMFLIVAGDKPWEDDDKLRLLDDIIADLNIANADIQKRLQDAKIEY